MTDENGLIDRVIAITEDLTDVIDQENALLKQRRPSETARLQAEKAKLTASYSMELQTLKRQAQAVKPAPSRKQSSGCAKSRSAFRKRLALHVRLVTTLKTVTENVLKSISDEVEPAQQSGPDLWQ